MKILVFIAGILIASSGMAQIQVSQQVIGSTGASYSGSINISSTVGESVIETGTSGNITATQGFHQPRNPNLLYAKFITTPESCKGANDATVKPEISGCEGPYQYLWSNGSIGNSVSGLSSGSYSVLISTENCEREFTFEIELASEEECKLEFYSGITPNNDGDNDYWHIENISLPRYVNNKVSIFNRWGNQVWSAEGYDNDLTRWEGQGKSNGNLPDGTYFYIAEVAGTVYKGYIELTR